MLNLIIIDVQYIQNVVFSFVKGLNSQSHSSDSHLPTKQFPPANFQFPHPSPITLFGKPCNTMTYVNILFIKKRLLKQILLS